MPKRDHRLSSSKTGLPLSALHQQTVALQLELSECRHVLKGRGIYQQDPELGRVLRIDFPEEAGCEFIIVEEFWKGDIRSGEDVGCDFLIRLGRAGERSSAGSDNSGANA